MLYVMKVSKKGQITIPAKIRRELGIKPGDKLFGEETKEGYLIKPPKKREGAMRGVADHVMGEDKALTITTLELEENEPLLTAEEEGLRIASAEFTRGEGRSFKEAFKEL